MSFLAELRRRNVIRMAGLYLVGAWLVVQVAETLLPAFDVPGWVLRALIIVLAIGFIPALIFSWVFELTPEGIKRESEVDRSRSVVDQTARKLDIAVIALLLCVGGLLLWTQFAAPAGSDSARRASAAAAAPADPPAPITDKSIAVLPFADFSQGGDQSWFADGLTEEILNALARTPDLLVSARTSSFKYKGSTLDVPEIAAELGVAHVLEGSVRSGAGRIRVTAQLIRAADGFHLWSQTYDRDAADVISIQEDLAQQIAKAMQTSMDPQALADMAEVGTHSVEAYQAYLRGVAEALTPTPEAQRRAYEHVETARELDPGFAAAHAGAANYWLGELDPTLTTSSNQGVSRKEMLARFQERIDLAIRHAKRDTDRLTSRALKAQLELRFDEAIALRRELVAARPTDAGSLNVILDMLTRSSQREAMREPLEQIYAGASERPDWANLYLNYGHRGPDPGLAADRAVELAERWRDEESMLYQAHRGLLWEGRVDAARAVLERWQQVNASSQWSAIPPARQASAEGRCDEVERLLGTLSPEQIPERWHVLQLLRRDAEAAEVLMPYERSGNLQALSGFLSYRQFDPTPYPSLLRLLERENVQRPPAEELPFACKPEGARK